MKQYLVFFVLSLLPLFLLSSYISPSHNAEGNDRDIPQLLFKSDSSAGAAKLQKDSLGGEHLHDISHNSGQIVAAKATGKVHSTTPCHSPVTTKNLHGLDGKGYLN
jgi:hypothetical protein